MARESGLRGASERTMWSVTENIRHSLCINVYCRSCIFTECPRGAHPVRDGGGGSGDGWKFEEFEGRGGNLFREWELGEGCGTTGWDVTGIVMKLHFVEAVGTGTRMPVYIIRSPYTGHNTRQPRFVCLLRNLGGFYSVRWVCKIHLKTPTVNKRAENAIKVVRGHVVFAHSAIFRIVFPMVRIQILRFQWPCSNSPVFK